MDKQISLIGQIRGLPLKQQKRMPFLIFLIRCTFYDSEDDNWIEGHKDLGSVTKSSNSDDGDHENEGVESNDRLSDCPFDK